MNFFISYSRIDKFLAKRFYVRLEQYGNSVFIDSERLRIGQELTNSLKRELKKADYILVIWTKNAYKSKWVKWEIQYVTNQLNHKGKVIPILIDATPADSCIQELVGINFLNLHRFENFFSALLRSLPYESNHKLELKNTQPFLDNNSRIKLLLENPIRRELIRLNKSLALINNKGDLEKKRNEIQSYWDNWSNEDISISGLPDMSDPEYHSLDYALWYKSLELVLNQDNIDELDKKVYPSLFGRILAKYGAGYEAIEGLIKKWPELSGRLFYDVIEMDFIATERLEVLTELFLEINLLSQSHTEKEYVIPYHLFGIIVYRNWHFLSPKSIDRILEVIELYVDKPYPGTPIDLMVKLCNNKISTERVFKIVKRWVARGLFDGINPSSGSETPKLCFLFIKQFHESYPDETNLLLEAIYRRIRAILRARDERKVYPFILNWIAAAIERLPKNFRNNFGNAIDEGLYSYEYESLRNSHVIRPSLASIRDQLDKSNIPIDDSKFREINQILAKEGIKEYII